MMGGVRTLRRACSSKISTKYLAFSGRMGAPTEATAGGGAPRRWAISSHCAKRSYLRVVRGREEREGRVRIGGAK